MAVRFNPSRLALGSSASLPTFPSANASTYVPSPARGLRKSASAPTKSGPKKKRSKAGRRPVEGTCANCLCSEHETGQWREDRSGAFGPGAHKLCSACGLYYNNHLKHRPRQLWAKGQRSSPCSSSGRTSRRASGRSTTSSAHTSRTSSSAQAFDDSAFYTTSPVEYVSPPSSPKAYSQAFYTLDDYIRPRIKLTVGKQRPIVPAVAGRSPSPESEEELTITLGGGIDGDREALGGGMVEEIEATESKAYEGGAVEALLALGDQTPTIPTPTPAPSRPSSAKPFPPYPVFRLLDTRPSFMYNQPPGQASPLLPWPVPCARPYAQPSEGLNLPPMRGMAQPSRRLPSLRELWLA